SDEQFKELTARVWGGKTYDELAGIGGMIIGSPEQVKAQVERLEAIGVDTLLLVCSFGSLSHAQVCRSLELFCRAVIHSRPTPPRPRPWRRAGSSASAPRESLPRTMARRQRAASRSP